MKYLPTHQLIKNNTLINRLLIKLERSFSNKNIEKTRQLLTYKVECETVLGQPQQLRHQSVLALVVEIQILAVLPSGAQERARQSEYHKQLSVAERRSYLTMLGEGPVGVHFGNLVHLAG